MLERIFQIREQPRLVKEFRSLKVGKGTAELITDAPIDVASISRGILHSPALYPCLRRPLVRLDAAAVKSVQAAWMDAWAATAGDSRRERRAVPGAQIAPGAKTPLFGGRRPGTGSRAPGAPRAVGDALIKDLVSTAGVETTTFGECRPINAPAGSAVGFCRREAGPRQSANRARRENASGPPMRRNDGGRRFQRPPLKRGLL
jgi:hypothetical protein